jgi:hypothetical protein
LFEADLAGGGPMNTKTYLIIFGSSLALMIVGSIIGNILESNGILNAEKIGPRGTVAITVAYFVLFCIMAFAIVPLVVRLFIIMQLKIGNGGFIFIKWLQAHEQAVVYGCWGMMVMGICIIYFLAKDDILKSLR